MFGLTEFQLFAATLVVVGVPAMIHFVLRQRRL
jgi:ABC-type maltose transport system permease subunit